MKTADSIPSYKQKNVPLSDIILPDDLIRQDIDMIELEELMTSILQVGLINPVTLFETEKGLVLKAGYRRYMAFVNLKRKLIPARIVTAGVQPGDQIMLDENLIRARVNMVDEAFWISKLMITQKLSNKEMALKLHKSETFISERLQVCRMDELLLAYLHAGQISLGVSLLLTKCKNLDDRKRLLVYSVENGATEKQVRGWVDTANFEHDQKSSDVVEGEFIETETKEYCPPETFCDVCEKKTQYLESKFIRICPDCFKIAKANLGPQKEVSNL